MTTKIDITSSLLEKSFDGAKNFLEKLIMPAVEETGLLIKDQISLFRFNNQIKMLNRAKIICDKQNISPKQISLKLLVPLLDYSGIEEDEILQDKWSILLSNLVDSEQNIENHVFPYILSQLSRNEYMTLEKTYFDKTERVRQLSNELENYKQEKTATVEKFKAQIIELELEISNLSNSDFTKTWDLRREKNKIEDILRSHNSREFSLRYNINKSEVIPSEFLKEFEISNMVRLGVLKEEKEFYAHSQTLEIPNDKDEYNSYTRVDLDVDVDSTTEIILTELGELFVKACVEKNKNSL